MTGFPPVKYDDWRKLVEKELKGESFDAKMFTPLCEGITLQPVYRAADLAEVQLAVARPPLVHLPHQRRAVDRDEQYRRPAAVQVQLVQEQRGRFLHR